MQNKFLILLLLQTTFYTFGMDLPSEPNKDLIKLGEENNTFFHKQKNETELTIATIKKNIEHTKNSYLFRLFSIGSSTISELKREALRSQDKLRSIEKNISRNNTFQEKNKNVPYKREPYQYPSPIKELSIARGNLKIAEKIVADEIEAQAQSKKIIEECNTLIDPQKVDKNVKNRLKQAQEAQAQTKEIIERYTQSIDEQKAEIKKLEEEVTQKNEAFEKKQCNLKERLEKFQEKNKQFNRKDCDNHKGKLEKKLALKEAQLHTLLAQKGFSNWRENKLECLKALYKNYWYDYEANNLRAKIEQMSHQLEQLSQLQAKEQFNKVESLLGLLNGTTLINPTPKSIKERIYSYVWPHKFRKQYIAKKRAKNTSLDHPPLTNSPDNE